MIKERPILFRGDMVKAILSGSKTMTRRPVKPLLGAEAEWIKWEGWEWKAIGVIADIPKEWRSKKLYCPYGQPGDILWVRETWAWSGDRNVPDSERTERGEIWYREDDGFGEWPGIILWRPSIHMPRWASRILLEIVAVRVERIQEITQGEAIDEGYSPEIRPFSKVGPPKHQFIESWNATYPGSWDRNDWVWVVEFKMVKL